MAAWKKCTRCHKVLQAEAFPSGSDVCSSCLSGPAPRVRAAKASPVQTVRSAAPRDHTGVVGSGDLEVRERRAKKAALEQLAEVHAEDYAQLLQAARRAEGLRS